MKRRVFLRRMPVAVACFRVSAGFAADTYPTKPIKVILPFSAGGQSDVVARFVAEYLSTGLGQPIVVENLAGAGGMIAAASVLRAAPDGYTLFLANASTLTIAPYLQKGNTIKPSAFTPISTVSQFPLVLVVKSDAPYRSVADLVAAAKSKPGSLSFASPGYGTTPHLIGEAFKREVGIDAVHVAYKGGAPALNDLLAGQVDFYFEAPGTLLSHILAGKIRPLAVTSRLRIRSLPEVRTLVELGMPGLVLESWSAFMAPPNTPVGVVERFRTEIAKLLLNDEAVHKLRERGFELTSSTPQALSRMVRDEGAVWSQLVKERQITTD